MYVYVNRLNSNILMQSSGQNILIDRDIVVYTIQIRRRLFSKEPFNIAHKWSASTDTGSKVPPLHPIALAHVWLECKGK